mgnify:CR=1 FL=1
MKTKKKKRAHRPGFGKQKGASFERLICKTLSLWVSKGKRDDLFWRSAMSGGRASVQFKKGVVNKTQSGDITAIDPLGAPLLNKFFIECKFYRDLHFPALLMEKEGKNGAQHFWRICQEQAAKYKKLPMLIMKQNGTMPTFFGVDTQGFDALGGTTATAFFPAYDLYLLSAVQFSKVKTHKRG